MTTISAYRWLRGGVRHGMHAIVFSAAILLPLPLLLQSLPARADVASAMPDYYSEPGLHLMVPGNGGLDIKIQRYYTSNVYLTRPNPFSTPPIPTALLSRAPSGVGWTIHLGRVITSQHEPFFGVYGTNRTNPN